MNRIRSPLNKPYRRSASPYALWYLLAALLLVVLAGWPGLATAQSTMQDDEEVAKQIDEMLADVFQPDAPGAAVIVVHNGQVVLRKGYGLANLELGVPVAPEMVFRLASVTKQFTAMAILMLSEEGKLALSDEVTEHLPDYPTHGQTITIENLLTHTGGVKEFSELAAWPALSRTDVTPEELIALFQDEPFDFAPGEQWAYSNSGYILLGAIIEKLSGLSYGEFIQQRIFTPLGMARSYYDDTTHLIPGRVAGYASTADGYANAGYLSMTHSYSAGALASTVDDLARWDTALYSNKLVRQATLRRAFKPYLLRNGQSTGYGYGWGIANYEGHPIEQHDGGIHGFNAQVMRLPADKVYIAILTNDGNNPVSLNDLAFNIATLVIGKPYQEPAAITLPAADLAAYEGVYQLDAKTDVVVRSDGDQLFVQASGELGSAFIASSPTEFFGEAAYVRIRFVKNPAGDVTGLRVQRHFGPWIVASKTDKPLPAPPEVVEVDPAILAQYVGEYEAADFSITISLEDSLQGETLMVKAPGEEKTELVPASASKFFIPAFGFQIEFVRDEAGAVSRVIIYMDGQEVPADRVR